LETTAGIGLHLGADLRDDRVDTSREIAAGFDSEGGFQVAQA
jgi:hypothetical protein